MEYLKTYEFIILHLKKYIILKNTDFIFSVYEIIEISKDVIKIKLIYTYLYYIHREKSDIITIRNDQQIDKNIIYQSDNLSRVLNMLPILSESDDTQIKKLPNLDIKDYLVKK